MILEHKKLILEHMKLWGTGIYKSHIYALKDLFLEPGRTSV